MDIKIEKVDQLKRTLKIKIDGNRFSEDKNKIYLEIGKTLKVPGFRPGTAPLEILEKRFGNLLKEEFLKRMVPVYCDEAFKNNNLDVVNFPKIYDLNLKDDSLTFSLDVEVKPQIDIDEKVYKGINIKDIKIEVKEEEVEKFITNLKEGIKKYINKDLDDNSIAKWLSYADIESFKNAIRTDLFIQKANDRIRKIQNQVKNHLLKEIKFKVPNSQIEAQKEELLRQNIEQLKLRGITDEDIEKYKKDLEEKVSTIAEEQVKLYYILEAISKKENIKVENELFEVVIGFILSNANYT